MLTMEQRMAEALRVYRMQPTGLVKALEALVESEIERRQQQELRTAGEIVCEHKHPTASTGILCRDCVAVERERSDDTNLETLGAESVR